MLLPEYRGGSQRFRWTRTRLQHPTLSPTEARINPALSALWLGWLGLLRFFIYYLLLSPFVRRLHCNLMHPKRALTVVHLLPHFHMERYTLLRGLVEWDQTPQSLTAA